MLNTYNRNQPMPPDEKPGGTLTDRAHRIFSDLCALNKSLGVVRSGIFGEAEEKIPSEPETSSPPLEQSLGGIEYQLQEAHGQVSSILNRL